MILDGIKDLDQKIETDPDNGELYYLRGQGYYIIGKGAMQDGKYDYALKTLSKAFPSYNWANDGEEAWFKDHQDEIIDILYEIENYGELFFAHTDYRSAIKCYTLLIEKEYAQYLIGCGISIFTDRGKAYLEKGETDLAIADFNSALELEESITLVPLYYRGLAYIRKGEYIKAATDFENALKGDFNEISNYVEAGYKQITQQVIKERLDEVKKEPLYLMGRGDWEAAEKLQKLGENHGIN